MLYVSDILEGNPVFGGAKAAMNLFGSENQLAYTRNCTELQERAKPTYMGLFLPFSTLIWLAKVRIVQPHLSRKRLLFSLVVNAPDESVSFYTFCRSQQVQAMNVFLFSAFHSHPRLFVQNHHKRMFVSNGYGNSTPVANGNQSTICPTTRSQMQSEKTCTILLRRPRTPLPTF